MTQADLRQAFEAFREECIWLRTCYNTYTALFESGKDTERLLRKTAAHFFNDLNRILVEYIFLLACKITDRAMVLGRGNLTVEALNNALEDAQLLTDEIREHSEGALRYRDILKDARNRVIAHIDKETVLSGQTLGEHHPEDVALFFEALQAYCDAVGNAVGAGPLDFRCSPGKGDVLDLIAALRREGEPDLDH